MNPRKKNESGSAELHVLRRWFTGEYCQTSARYVRSSPTLSLQRVFGSRHEFQLFLKAQHHQNCKDGIIGEMVSKQTPQGGWFGAGASGIIWYPSSTATTSAPVVWKGELATARRRKCVCTGACFQPAEDGCVILLTQSCSCIQIGSQCCFYRVQCKSSL